MGKLAESKNGTRENPKGGGGEVATTPPLLRERVKYMGKNR